MYNKTCVQFIIMFRINFTVYLENNNINEAPLVCILVTGKDMDDKLKYV